MSGDKSIQISGADKGHGLDAANIQQIKDRHAAGGITQKQLADAYSVSQQSISKVLAGKTWGAKRKRKTKVRKPYPDFPLTAHPNGLWCKKILGKLHYFGPIADSDAALKRYLDDKDYLHAGLKPPHNRDGLSVVQLCNHFLTDRRHRVQVGEMRQRTWQDYYDTCEIIIDAFKRDTLVEDLHAEDFVRLRQRFAGNGRGPVSIANLVRVTRMVFKFAWDAELIDRSVRFGPTFKEPNKRVVRADKRKRGLLKKGSRTFTAAQIRDMLDAADPTMEAMILLACNCGFGNSDLGQLPKDVIDFGGGWCEFPRPKTEISRRAKLWPETAKSLKVAISNRPRPKDPDHDGLVFLTKYGQPWSRDSRVSPLSAEFRKMLNKLGYHRPGIGFYAFRRVFETIGGQTLDQVAVNYIMGHSDNSMADVYRDGIDDERLIRVADHVRAWLFAAEPTSERVGEGEGNFVLRVVG